MRRICEKLSIGARGPRPRDRLRLGRLRAARRVRARRAGHRRDDLAQQQPEPASRQVREAGLADRVEILLVDYRALQAVHEDRLDRDVRGDRREAVRDVLLDLRPPALARRACRPADDRRTRPEVRALPARPDWIRATIFPGCPDPEPDGDRRAATRASGLIVHGLEDIGPGYADTLREWRARFFARDRRGSALGYDERFVRTWDFYLAICEAPSGPARCAIYSSS